MWQGTCGCVFTQPKPNRWPWYYKPGSWQTWKPVSRGGDEWCRWTLVVGIGPITGVLVIPLWQCRGCEACGPHVMDGVCAKPWNRS